MSRWVLAFVMLTACTSQQASVTTPSPSQGLAASPSPAVISCRLPYLKTDGYNPFNAVGFLTLPEGAYEPDNAAGSSLPPGGVQASPIPGGSQPWWDAAMQRWIPVSPSSESPKGSSYAYMSEAGLHVVDIATGLDTLLYRRPKGVQGGQVLGFLDATIYIVFPAGVKDGTGGVITNPVGQVGVWKIDVGTRVSSRVFTSDQLGVMAAGGLWVAGDQLVEVDVVTGQSTVWFKNPTNFMEFLGVDASELPVISTFDGSGHLDIWHLKAPNKATIIYSVDYTGDPPVFGPEMQQGLLVADRNGVWFGAADGLWLYDGTNFRRISSVSGIPAGPCS